MLTTHVAAQKLSDMGENNLTAKDIYDRDVAWLEESELLVAEVSVPSLGIGYELGLAERLGKQVICLYDNNSDKSLSAMIEGNENFIMFKYSKIEEVLDYLENFLRKE